MERGELVKRLSLLEEQKNLFLENIETAKTNGWLKDFDDDDDDQVIESEKLTAVNMVNADNTILEQQSLSTLDFRVHHLEKSIYGFDPITKKASLHEKFKEQLSLLKRVDEIKKEFNTIVRERDGADGLKSFLEICKYLIKKNILELSFKKILSLYTILTRFFTYLIDDQVSEFVSPFKDSALSMERFILTPEAKAEIISSSSEELKLVAENLKQIDELQPIIEATEFKGIQKIFFNMIMCIYKFKLNFLLSFYFRS
jgi:hypothetical protein